MSDQLLIQLFLQQSARAGGVKEQGDDGADIDIDEGKLEPCDALWKRGRRVLMEAGERGRWKGGSGEGKWSCDACDASRRRTGAMDSGVPSKDPRRDDSPLASGRRVRGANERDEVRYPDSDLKALPGEGDGTYARSYTDLDPIPAARTLWCAGLSRLCGPARCPLRFAFGAVCSFIQPNSGTR